MSEQKRLYRSTSDKMVCGVAGGIAEYLGIDPVLIRLAFVLLTLANGTGLLLYIVLCVIMPEQGAASKSAAGEDSQGTEEGSGFEPLGSRGE